MKKIISFLAMAFIVMTVPFTTVAQNTLKNEEEACSITIDGQSCFRLCRSRHEY
jgi:glucose uptake protein GlcU